jgi:hypothetical protein
MIAGELAELVAELVPALREAVQEHDQRPVARVRVVKLHAVHLCIVVYRLL